MSEWTRLTPEGQTAGDGSTATYRYDELYGANPHIIDVGGANVDLSDPELLALAQVSGVYRQVPEVRALVAALETAVIHLDVMLAGMQAFPTQENDPVERAICSLVTDGHTALAPFVEEPTDATD